VDVNVDVRQTIREFIQANFYASGAVGDHDSLVERGLLDSTGVLEVVAFLEAEFEIRIQDDQVVRENLETIDAIARLVAQKQAEGPVDRAAPEVELGVG
jgi:acyl carrier protein